MSKSNSFLLLLHLFLLGGLLGGCGSDSSSVFTGTAGQEVALDAPLPIAGKLFVGVPVAGAAVELVSPQGVLAQTVTDESGNFFFERPAGLSAFRVRATLPNSSLVFTRDVRVTGANAPFVLVNVPSTLVGQLMAGGQTDLAAAEAQVAAALGLSVDALGVVEESRHTPFSHLGFFLTIAQQGPFGDFSVTKILAQGTVEPPYLHDLETLDQPWASLEQELVSLLEPVRTTSLAAAQASQAQSSAGLLTGIFQGLGEKVVSNAEESALTWTGHLLGFNYGINAAIEGINAKLDTIVMGIDDLSAQLANSTFSTANDQLSQSISDLQTLQNDADLAVENTQLTDVPQAIPSDTSSFLTALGNFSAQSTLTSIQKACLGLNQETNLVTLGAAISLQDYNFNPPSQPFVELMGMPVRSNMLLDQALTTYQVYAGYQTMATNVLAENAHAPSGALNMVSLSRTASALTSQAAYSMALQRQQLPRYLPSDNVLVDLQNGIMWYLPIQSPMKWNDARSFAAGFSLPGADGVVYKAWHLPTQEEFETLQTRGRLVKQKIQDSSVAKNSDKGEGDYGRTTQGIAALGFTNAKVFDSDGNVWMTRYYYNVDNFPNSLGLTRDYFRLNHESSNVRGGSASDKNPVILCRSILNTDVALFGSTVYPVVYPPAVEVGPDLVPGQALQAGEVAALGQLTAIGDPVVNGDQVTFPLTYSITLGGKFRAGTNSVGQDEDVTPATYTYQVDTNQPHTVEPNSQSTTLAQVLSYSIAEVQNLFAPYTEVSNFDGNPGQLTNHTDPGGQPSQVTLQAESFGANASGLVTLKSSASATASPTNRSLVSLLVTPRNVLFPGATPSQPFLAVGFYDDLTVEDLTQQVTWTITDPSGNPVPSTTAELSINPKGTLKINGALVPMFNLNAAFPGGPTDTTKIQVTQFQQD